MNCVNGTSSGSQDRGQGEGEKSLLLTAVADIMNCYVVETNAGGLKI